jgi:hypothetical protein
LASLDGSYPSCQAFTSWVHFLFLNIWLWFLTLTVPISGAHYMHVDFGSHLPYQSERKNEKREELRPLMVFLLCLPIDELTI